MATLTTSIRTDQPDKKGLCRLIIIYRNGNEAAYKHPIGEKVLPEQFDQQKEKVVKHPKAKEINYIIDQSKKIINDIVFDLQRDNIIPTTKRVKSLVKKIINKKKVESIVKVTETSAVKFDINDKWEIPSPKLAWIEFIELKKNLVDADTVGIYKTTLQHLENFCILRNRLLNWKLFDNDFYNHWNNYFIEDCENQFGDIGFSNNTIGKYFKTLKTFLYWAVDKEYHDNFKFKKYKVLQETIDIHPLSEAHLAQIVAFCDDNTNELRLRRVGSLFVFLAATGMRYSDGQNLKWADLYYSGEGDIEQQVIRFTSQKTGQKIMIPFSPYSLKELIRNALEFEKGKTKISEILTEQTGLFDFNEIRNYFKHDEDFEKPLMPQISSAKFNQYIKEVGEKCNFIEPVTVTRKSGSISETKRYKRWEKLASHDCRRTFITLSLAKGMRPETVMTFTGHSSYKTMMRYNKLTEKVKINEFHDIWGKSVKTFDDVFGNAELTVGGTKKEDKSKG